jgi:hypothetical protein
MLLAPSLRKTRGNAVVTRSAQRWRRVAVEEKVPKGNANREENGLWGDFTHNFWLVVWNMIFTFP